MDARSDPARCPVCGREMADESESLVRAWPGQYAHDDCASYARRPRGEEAESSHRVYRKFTRT